MTQSPEERAKGILPFNKVVTVIETKENADKAVAALIDAGIPDDDILLHHGEQADKYFDADGTNTSLFHNLVRRYQRLQGIEKKMFDDLEVGLEKGYYMLGVETHGNDKSKMTIRDAINPYTSHHIFYCSRFTISILEFAD